MLWLIDSCQNKVSGDQYHMTVLWVRVLELIEIACVVEVSPCQDTGF